MHPEESNPFVKEATLNNIWLFTSAFLIIMMQPGFAMLEAGNVNSKNVVNVLFKNLLDFCISLFAFWLIGYAFAYGDSKNGFIGTTGFALSDDAYDISELDDLSSVELVNSYGLYFNRMAFSATAATIVSGSLAERCKLDAYFLYSFMVSSFIYPVVACWCWGQGWLSPFGADPASYLFYGGSSNNFIDFAGCGVVHMVGGFCGLVGAIMLGPRLNRFEEDGTPNKTEKHSLICIALGTMLLVVGWFGFNSGSTYCVTPACTVLAAKIAVITSIGGSAGAFTTLLYQKAVGLPYDLSMVCNGLLAGLVSITGACGVIDVWAAVPISVIGTLLHYECSILLLRMEIDDPLAASSVHGVAGAWGVLAVGIFGTDRNAAFAGYKGSGCFKSGEQFGVQLVGVVVILAWVVVTSMIVFYIIDLGVGLRHDEAALEDGLDVTEHDAKTVVGSIDLYNQPWQGYPRRQLKMHYLTDDDRPVIIPLDGFITGNCEDVD